ncbi:hypothetical protein AMQ83_07965, partial [Paenibacillus riograndensis]
MTQEARSQSEGAVAAARKLESDYIGFGEAVQRENPRGRKKILERWEDIFAACGIEIMADTVIRRTDMRGNSVKG